MPDKEQAAAAKAKGNEFFKAENFAEAVKHFTEAISHDATDHVFYSNRSACYASMGKYDEALADGVKCVELKPEFVKGYSRKGLAEFNMGKLEDASATYAAGLKLAPADAALIEGARNVKAQMAAQSMKVEGDPIKEAVMAAVQQPQWREHLKDQKFSNLLMQVLQCPAGQTQQVLLAAMQQDERFGELLMSSMGGAGGMGGAGARPVPQDPRPSKPVEVSAPCRPSEKKKVEVEDLRTENQKKADEFKVKANELYKKRSFEEAIGEYDKAIEIEPNDATYYNNKAAVLLEQAEYDKCMQVCQSVLDKRYEMNGALEGGATFEKIGKIYIRMAACFQRQKKFDEAIEMYYKAQTEDNSKGVRNGLRDCEKAKSDYEKAAYLDPELAEKHKDKGNEFFKAGNSVEAKKEYDEAIKRNPKDHKLYSNRAGALLKLMCPVDAIRDLDECLKLDPKFVRAYARKGQAHSQMKEHHKALKAYEDGLKVDPDNQELLQGRQQVMYLVQQGQSAGQDQDQLRHAMADPDIQDILKDPQMNIVLQNMQDDPKRINEYMKDPQIASAINKLIAAGVMKVGNQPGQ